MILAQHKFGPLRSEIRALEDCYGMLPGEAIDKYVFISDTKFIYN